MITTDLKTGRVEFFITPERKLEMSASEYQHFANLIKHPPPPIPREITNPPKLWSPCIGEGCTHSSHKKRN